MTGRDPNAAVMDGEDESYDGLLSPCETYEGSKHYAVSVDDELDAAGSRQTTVMSAALLAKLRAEIREQASREPLETRATQRSMAAVRPEEHR